MQQIALAPRLYKTEHGVGKSVFTLRWRHPGGARLAVAEHLLGLDRRLAGEFSNEIKDMSRVMRCQRSPVVTQFGGHLDTLDLALAISDHAPFDVFLLSQPTAIVARVAAPIEELESLPATDTAGDAHREAGPVSTGDLSCSSIRCREQTMVLALLLNDLA
jgi:hypothetical protein